MKDLFGSYVWHFFGNENKAEGLKANHRYLVCVENVGPERSEWLMMTANWYNEGDELTLYEPNGTPHYNRIKSSGFYAINDTGNDRFSSIFQLCGVSYWTDIKLPETNPEDILTIL